MGKSLLICIFISLFSVYFSVARAAADDQKDDNTDDKQSRELRIQYSNVRARVSPTFELALPSSKVTLSFNPSFNELDLIFYLGYGILSGDINSELTFAYNIKRFRPYIKFFQNTDFENLIQPGIEDSGIVLVPSSKYIYRSRGFELGVGYRLAPRLYVEPAFLFDDIFKGSLTESRILEEGIDLVPKLSFVYDGVTARDPSNQLLFKGIYYRTILNARFREDFNRPVELKNENLYLHHFYIKRSWFFLLRGTLDYPIAIWAEELASFYQLGGFDTIRGYEYRSINAFSFFLFTVETEREVFKDREVVMFKNRLTMHQFRFKLLCDSLLYQDSYGLASNVQYLASLGTGISLVFTGRKNSHFRTELFVAQGIQSGAGPIVYFRTTLFNLESQL
jgi:hypothetical protein